MVSNPTGPKNDHVEKFSTPRTKKNIVIGKTNNTFKLSASTSYRADHDETPEEIRTISLVYTPRPDITLCVEYSQDVTGLAKKQDTLEKENEKNGTSETLKVNTLGLISCTENGKNILEKDIDKTLEEAGISQRDINIIKGSAIRLKEIVAEHKDTLFAKGNVHTVQHHPQLIELAEQNIHHFSEGIQQR